MLPTKDYDIIFEKLLNKELEVLYKDLIQFFNINGGLSNTHNLALYIAKLNFKTEELIALKPYDYWHPFDDFIQELIKSFPYKQHEENYKSSPIENFFKYEFLEIKKDFITQTFPYHYNEQLFNAKPVKIIEVMANYFAIKDFILKANSIKILDRDRPQKVAERIKKSRGVIPLIKTIKESDVNLIVSQQVLIMHYIFSALDLNDKTTGIKNTKNRIIELLTGKSLVNIKKLMVNPLNYKSPKNTIEDIESIKLLLLNLGNKKIQKSIMDDINLLKSNLVQIKNSKNK
jgi:hypothetical protein